MIRGHDLDERVEGVVGSRKPGRRRRLRDRSPCARGRGRRSRRSPRRGRVVAVGKEVAGVDVAVDRREGTSSSAGAITASYRSSQRSTSAAAICRDVVELRAGAPEAASTSQRMARWASGCEKPASAWSRRATAAPTARRAVGLDGPGRECRAVDQVTSWTAWSTPPISTAPVGRRSIVRRGRGIGSADRPGGRAPSRAPASRRPLPGRPGCRP